MRAPPVLAVTVLLLSSTILLTSSIPTPASLGPKLASLQALGSNLKPLLALLGIISSSYLDYVKKPGSGGYITFEEAVTNDGSLLEAYTAFFKATHAKPAAHSSSSLVAHEQAVRIATKLVQPMFSNAKTTSELIQNKPVFTEKVKETILLDSVSSAVALLETAERLATMAQDQNKDALKLYNEFWVFKHDEFLWYIELLEALSPKIALEALEVQSELLKPVEHVNLNEVKAQLEAIRRQIPNPK